jgi:ankyrin repeat protein
VIFLSKDSKTPLHVAVDSESLEVVSLLLANDGGTNVDRECGDEVCRRQRSEPDVFF